MLKFLLDANLSPETAEAIRELGYNTRSIQEEGLGELSDEEIVELAKREKRIIITFDQDLADAWYFREHGKVGVILLRTHLQTVEHLESVLTPFIEAKVIEKEKLKKSLTVLSEAGHRIVRY